jgi:hypothetical protein
MNLPRFLTATVLAVSIPFPAIAHPHQIAQLGNAPLIGEIASTAQLKVNLVQNQALFEAARSKLGISAAEYAQFTSSIAAGRVAYVTLPRHLDAMTWSSAGRVYALRDVIIPRSTKGWEVDLVEPGQTVALFVPARCGNLSIVRRPRPRVAVLPFFKHIAPRTLPLTVAAQQYQPQPQPVATPDASSAAAINVATISQSTQTHRSGWWPLLLVPIALLFHGSGGTPLAPIPSLNSGPTPPIGCTTKIVH